MALLPDSLSSSHWKFRFASTFSLTQRLHAAVKSEAQLRRQITVLLHSLLALKLSITTCSRLRALVETLGANPTPIITYTDALDKARVMATLEGDYELLFSNDHVHHTVMGTLNQYEAVAERILRNVRAVNDQLAATLAVVLELEQRIQKQRDTGRLRE